MAKFYATGRLGQVKERNGGYLAFSIAEGSYKTKEGTYQTSWFNFLVKEDEPVAKFLQSNCSKIDVVEVTANEGQAIKNGITTYFHSNINVKVVTWKKSDQENKESESDVIELKDSELPI